MKKVITLALALVLALTMAVMSTAAVADDVKAFFNELSGTVDAATLKDAVQSVLDDLNIPIDVDADDLDEGADAAVAAGLIEKLGLEGTDIANKLQDAMSNDFVSFLAGMYTKEKIVSTGDSNTVVAIAGAVALCAVAAAAFVVMKKKED